MFGPRIGIVLAIGCLAAAAKAQWTVTNLYPAGSSYSACYAVDDGMQGGLGQFGSNGHAGYWTGTAASWVDLNPTGSTSSAVRAIDGGRQFGEAKFGSATWAGYWNGTSSSWVSLHPAGSGNSSISAALGDYQVGYVLFTGGTSQASLWNGTAASRINLHPAGMFNSSATDLENGKQVGYASPSNNSPNAGMWSGTAASWVSLHPAGATLSSATCISGNRQGGYAKVGATTMASLWSGTPSSWISLHPASADYSMVEDMNGDLQVGVVQYAGVNHAAVWTSSVDSYVDLHSFLPQGYKSSRAYAVWRNNTTAYVVGYSVDALGQVAATMWSRPLAGGFALSLNKSTVAGQNSVQGTITMNAPSSTNTTFSTYDNSSLVTTPPTVTVLANTTSKSFQITTTAITSTINTTIYAQRGAETRSQPLTLTPLIPTAMSFTPNPVTGGQSTSCKLVINGVAGPGGRTIAMLDNSPNATVPATVVVPAGATSVTFPITTTPVTTVKTVTVTARVSAGEKTATFRINP